VTRAVVIGGGASGVLAAVALADRPGVDSVTVVERSVRVGPGLAYGTAAPHHLLNSPAGRMSAIDEEDGHFVAWSAAHGTPVAPAGFAPRRQYGDYLAAVFDDLVGAEAGRVTAVRDEAVGIDLAPDGAVVRLAGGGALDADRVVLALGNPPPIGRGATARVLAVADPWAPGALDGIEDGSVLVLGTGLTMIDVATTLTRRAPLLRVTATSRGLLLPRRHLDAPVPPGPGLRPRDASLGALLSAFDERLRAARREGRPWQAEVDGVRPQVNGLWAALSVGDRRRFVERVSRRWEVHRHRMAPAVAAEVSALREDGRLRIEPLTDARAFTAVIDATGPRATAAPGWSRLLDGLIRSGSARPDALGIGIDVTAEGAVRDAAGSASPVLWLLGPGRRGTQWESTAVPEIRQHAVALAAAAA
jgi:uncharacterized NAD(P)/FAD-binding protein YdhS